MDPNDLVAVHLELEGSELTLHGSPAALRQLAYRLESSGDTAEVVAGSGGMVRQTITAGPLCVGVDREALTLAGSRESLELIWWTLRDLADEAEEVGHAPIERHAHIEYLGSDDAFRAPESMPLVVTAGWPE